MITSDLLIGSLDSIILIEVEGRDAERYLNNRLSTDIKILKIGEYGKYSAALSVQGKTEALFFIHRKGPENYILLADGGDPAVLLNAVSRYKVADKVTFEERSKAFQIFHICSLDPKGEHIEQVLLQNETINQNSILIYRRNRFGSYGVDIVLAKSSVPQVQLALNSLNCTSITQEQQQLLRLQAHIPSFPIEIGPEFLIQESSLEGCYSTNKGCYVGQEVIQKIASFASTPSKLLAFECLGELTNSDVPTSEPNGTEKIGNILSHSYDANSKRTYGFMRIKSKALTQAQDMMGFIGNTVIRFFTVFDFTKN